MAVDGPLYEHRSADPIRVGGSRGQLAGDEPTRMGHGPGSPRTVQLQAVPGEPPVRSGIGSKETSLCGAPEDDPSAVARGPRRTHQPPCGTDSPPDRQGLPPKARREGLAE